MRQIMVAIIAAFAGATLMATDYTYTWQSGSTPSSILDGKVTMGWSGTSMNWMKISGIVSGDRIVFTGDDITFSANWTYVTNTVAGTELVFRNKVAADNSRLQTVFSGSNADTWNGDAVFLTTNRWKTVFTDKRLENIVPLACKQTASSQWSGWANPGNKMSVAAVKLEGNVLKCQYQTDATANDAYDGGAKNALVKIVCVEFRQADDDIEGRVTGSWQVWSRTANQLTSGFDVDELEVASGPNWFAHTYGGKAYSKRRYVVFDNDTLLSGYGINTVKVSNSDAFRVAFEDEAVWKTLKPTAGTLIEHADASKASDAFYYNAVGGSPKGAVALRDGSIEWKGSITSASGDVRFETTKDIGTDPYRETASDPYWFVTNEWNTVATNRRLVDLLAATNRAFLRLLKQDGSYYYPYGTNETVASTGFDGNLMKPDENTTWAYVNGKNVGGNATQTKAVNGVHPGGLYNLKFNEAFTEATGQFQAQQKAYIRCVHVKFQQNGNDIRAMWGANKAYTILATNEAFAADYPNLERLIGVDFDTIIANKSRYGSAFSETSIACGTHADGFGVRDLHLVFSEPATRVIGVNLSNSQQPMAGSVYTIAGTDTARMAVDVKSFWSIASNGMVRVLKGGELWLGGTWNSSFEQPQGIAVGVGHGACELFASAGAAIRQYQSYVFGLGTKVTLDGGVLELGRGRIDASDVMTTLPNLTLRNGALVYDNHVVRRYVCAGNVDSMLTWKIEGDSPSTNTVNLCCLGRPNESGGGFTFDVADTGDYSADFVHAADLVAYPSAEYKVNKLYKTGTGTMLLTGDYGHPDTITVSEGVLKLGETATWSSGAGLVLDGGGFAVGGNVSVSTLTIGENGGSISVPAGASVAFADSHELSWTAGTRSVLIDANLEQKPIRFGTDASGLKSVQLKCFKIVVDGKIYRAKLDDDGYLCACGGLSLLIR